MCRWMNRAERESQRAEPLPEGQRRMALANTHCLSGAQPWQDQARLPIRLLQNSRRLFLLVFLLVILIEVSAAFDQDQEQEQDQDESAEGFSTDCYGPTIAREEILSSTGRPIRP